MSASWSRIRAIHQKYGFIILRHRFIGQNGTVVHKNKFSIYAIRNRVTVETQSAYCNRHVISHVLNKKIDTSPCYKHKNINPKHYSSSSTNRVQNISKHRPAYESVEYEVPTAPGEKKDTSIPLPKAYSPKFVEAAWYDWWVKQGFFSPTYKNDKEKREKFVICLPPPNITGTLHVGHALTNSIQDALCRWNRMKGRETLWIPGIDHAGIATQVIVEKKLMRERGVTRHDIGRDRFIEEVWKWKHEKGDTIYNQMKKLGSSLDWDRTCFTMDKNLSEAVTEAFIRLHDEGLIYRGKRLVNWSCHLKSTISDIEVENLPLTGKTKLRVPGYDKEHIFGTILTFAYKVKETGELINVSTTRPETILGDTAVCVHPDDARYTHLHGNHVVRPFDGCTIPIICDEFVNMNFGTGVVKITPAHDFTDNEVGRRHNLPNKVVIDEDGTMINVPKRFLGMKRFDAREAVTEGLKEKHLYRSFESHAMSIPLCSRSKDVIEPLIKEQWYLNCQDMAKQAIQQVQDGYLKITPEYFSKTWYYWLKDCVDWCLSRQIWWGHRIPAYSVKVKGQTMKEEVWISARNKKEAEIKASERLRLPVHQFKLEQDNDVLDTWFSSGLFPYSPLGWPNKTEDYVKYYPTTILETGHDIVFFWVARMVMLGLKLTGELPFKEILLHGTLRDSFGRKMSKSLGNVINPMDVIHGTTLQDLQKQIEMSNLDPKEEKKAKKGQKTDFPTGIPECGTDALRFTLCCSDVTCEELNMSITAVKNNRHFCNKIWQGYKFVLMNLGDNFTPSQDFKTVEVTDPIDQWILSRLSHMVRTCNKSFESYNFHVATAALYNFWIGNFCDVYLESVKPVFIHDNSRQEATKQTLYHCVDVFLRALSPFMPFLTEELYQRLPKGDNQSWPESICISQYPEDKEFTYTNKKLEDLMNVVKSVNSAVQQVKQEYEIKAKVLPPVSLRIKDEEIHKFLNIESVYQAIMSLTRAKSIEFSDDVVAHKRSVTISVSQDVDITLLLEGIIEPQTEIDRLEKTLAKQKKAALKIKTEIRKADNKSHQAKLHHSGRLMMKLENIEKEIQEIADKIDAMKIMR